MTIQEFNEKYKEDKDALQFVSDLEAKAKKNYLEDNLKLQEENTKLKQNNELLYNQIMNGAGKKEEENAPRFQDYSEDIVNALRNTR